MRKKRPSHLGEAKCFQGHWAGEGLLGKILPERLKNEPSTMQMLPELLLLDCCCMLKKFLIKIAAKNNIEAHKGNEIRTVTWGFVRGREQKKSFENEDSKNDSFLYSKWIVQPLASAFHLIPHRKCLLSL